MKLSLALGSCGLLISWATFCGAEESGEIRGVVLDASGGEPLARVEINLSPTPYRAVTEVQGRFALPGIKPGVHTLQASTVGYRLVRLSFTLAPGEIKEFEIILSPDSLRQSESIEVRAGPFDLSRQDSPAELTLQGGEAKNLASVLADDPLRAVQGLPGVTSNDDFNSYFSLRGAAYHRIGLYLDDLQLHAPFHMVQGEDVSGSLTVINGDILDGLALHTGAYPVRYGDSTAGALDVRTREGSRLKPALRLTASASNTGLLAEGPLGRNRRGAWLASIRKSYLEYLIRRVTTDPSLAFGFFDVLGSVSYDFGRRHNLSLEVLDGFSGLDRTSGRTRLGFNSTMTSGYHFSLANLAWRFTPSGRLVVMNRLGILRERFDNDNREGLPLASGHYGEWVWNANGAWMWHGENALDFGGSVRRIRDDGFSARYQFNPFAVRRIEDYRGTGLRAGAFVQQSWRMAGGRIRPALGLRLDRDSVNEVQSLSGQGSIAFLLRPSTRIHLGWGQCVQHPDLQWLYSRVGSRGLLPERANHFLVALEERLGERTRLRMEFYHRQDRDLLFRSFYEPRLIGGNIFNPPTDPPMRNALRGYARGMEIFLQRRSANRLAGWVSYALGYATLRDPAAGISFPSDQDQRHTVNVYLSYRLRPTVNLSVKSLYGSGFPMPGFYRREDAQYFLSETRNSLRLDSYQRADFRINKAYTFKHGKITLYAEIINFLNSRNRRFGSFNGYNPSTGQVAFTLLKMFPVLPSAGFVLDH